MDKNIIKSFAIESRRQMVESVKYQASLIGITAEGINEPISKAEGMETYDYGAGTFSIFDEDIPKRESLVREVKNKGYDNVVEEVAYTWFNRIIAIRFMEVNDYIPTRTRVLSSETKGKTEPDIIADALDLELNYSDEDLEIIIKYKEENKLDDLFQLLFIKQCNKLNEILPWLFEKTDDWMELLLDISFINKNGIIRKLINIPENIFNNQVEIIGWLYQFYNTELKAETDKINNVPKEKIPFITQLFTPNWIVKYMVENSLGRLWLDSHNDGELKSTWEYYLDDIEQNSNVEYHLTDLKNNAVDLEEIKIIDPCMGSGHILVYAFDVLMQIYLSEGFTKNDATISILKNNLHGIDVDDRAFQLTYFSIMMKAREYNRNIFNENIYPHVLSIKESNDISYDILEFIEENGLSIKNELKYILDVFKDSKEWGSLLILKNIDYGLIKRELLSLNRKSFNDVISLKYKQIIFELISILELCEILSNKYDVVITNPPYLAAKKMNANLKKFLKNNYPNTKGDLCVTFIEKCFDLSKKNGLVSLITQNSFMFLSTYEKLRKYLLEKNLINLIHLGSKSFEEIKGEKVQTASFVFRNYEISNYVSVFYRLIDYGSSNLKQMEFFNPNNRFLFNLEDCYKIPGMPFSYWVDNSWINIFREGKPLSKIGDVKAGLQTANNEKFLRLWHEIDIKKFSEFNDSSLSKWFPYNKGGNFRKWYGNHEYLINWENNGFELKNFKKSVIRNPNFYFKKSISWSLLGSPLGIRFYPEGFLFDMNGSSLFLDDENYYYIGGCLGSKVANELLSILNPTLAFQVGNIKTIPIIFSSYYFEEVNNIVKENIEICKNDYDDYETSWNFNSHPFIKFNGRNLREIFENWNNYKINQFSLLKSNEIKLNNIFSKIYAVDINEDADDKIISVTKANYEFDVQSFISFSVGCIFGRYSLDKEGLEFAGGNFNINDYSTFIPDDDNVIPVLDTEYFTDDIVGRFVEFVKICFGEETLEENLDFIAGALKKKGKTSREIIRNYFLTDFFKNHVQTYSKLPIYWQFDSGKQNAFKCLIYMHRYESNLIARVRTDYLHKTQKAIEQNLVHCDKIIANSSNKSEVSKATKDKTKYIKQLDEIKVYDEALRHMASQNIEIDLDDGVKVNYAKFQNVKVSMEGEKPKKINLLKKI